LAQIGTDYDQTTASEPHADFQGEGGAYIPMVRGFFCFVAVVDWFTRRVLSHRVAIPTEAGLCVEALEEALADNVHSTDVILNILARRRDPAPPLTIATPDADYARYDRLRRLQ